MNSSRSREMCNTNADQNFGSWNVCCLNFFKNCIEVKGSSSYFSVPIPVATEKCHEWFYGFVRFGVRMYRLPL